MGSHGSYWGPSPKPDIIESKATRLAQCHILAMQVNGHNVYQSYSEGDTLVALGDDLLRRIFIHHDTYMSSSVEWWLESVGSMSGFCPIPLHEDIPIQRLLCFQDSQGNVLHTGFDTDSDTTDCYNRGFGGDVLNQESKFASIYPNPADQNITIELPTGLESVNVAIYNLWGQMVMDREIIQEQASFNVSNLPKGLYIVRINTSMFTYSAKFVKQ